MSCQVIRSVEVQAVCSHVYMLRVGKCCNCRYEGLVKDEMCHLRGVSDFADSDRQVGTTPVLSPV